MYEIGDKAKLIDADIECRIDAVLQEQTGFQYRVSYWHECNRFSVWVYTDEIRPIFKKSEKEKSAQ